MGFSKNAQEIIKNLWKKIINGSFGVLVESF